MKLKHGILFFSIIFLIWSCTTQPAITPDSARDREGTELFLKAEAIFEAKQQFIQNTQFSIPIDREKY